MKKNFYIFLAFALLHFAAFGCSAINQVKKEIDKSQQPKVIKSVDGKAQVTVPATWKPETELHDSATVQASNGLQQLFIMVIPLGKVDLADNFTLDKMHDLTRREMSENLIDAKFGDSVSTVINGYEARQFEVAGTVEGFKVKYIYTTVDAPDNYYQIAAYTPASRYDGSKEQLLEVINSFQENSSAGAEIPSTPPIPAEPSKPKKK